MMITGCRSFLLMLLVCCSTSSLWAMLHAKNNRVLTSAVNQSAIKEKKSLASVVVSPKRKRFAFIKNCFFFVRNFLGLSLVWQLIIPSRRRIFGCKRASLIEFFTWVTACCNSALLVYAYQKQGSAKGVTEVIARLADSFLQRPVVIANPLVQQSHQDSGTGSASASQNKEKPIAKPVVPAAAPVGFDLWTD